MEEENQNPFLYELELLKKGGVFPVSSIPEKGFIRDYLEYACKLSDAPLVFNFFAAITLLSVCSHRMEYPFGAQNKRLNTWIVLVAPTAFYRKSTAARTGIAFLKMIMPSKNESLIFPNDFSTEKLMAEIAIRKMGLFHWDEMGGVLARFERSYMAGAKELFTELFENAYFVRKLQKGEDVVIDNPYISILTSTTFEWFEGHVKSEDVEGGWLNRFMYCLITDKPRSWSMPKFSVDYCEQICLRDILFTIFNTGGVIEFSEESKQTYDEYYKWFEKDFEKRDSKVKNLYIRLPLYCIKLACLYAVNNHLERLIIEDTDMRQAIDLTKWIMESSYEESSTRLLTDKDFKNRCRILNIIKREGKEGLKRADLYANARLNARRLDEIIQTLLESGEIIIKSVLAEKSNRAIVVYVYSK